MNGGRTLSAAIVVGVMLAVAHPAGAAATRETAEATVPDLPNPPEIRSRHGVLDAVFLTEPGKVTVATERFTSNVYNDLYIPPTLRVRRGDTLLLRLVNRIGPADVEITQKQPTNIHFHGMDVSPKRPGDNVFVNVSPGKSFQYRVEIPNDHPQGLHWYHSHLHEFVDPQILSGLSGMLIVDGGLESHYPELANAAAAGHGAQGHQPARRQRPDADRQWPGQPADPQPPWRAPGLGDRQSGRRQLLRPQARGAPVLGAGARRQLPAPAAAAGYAVPAARRAHAGGRRSGRSRAILLPDHRTSIPAPPACPARARGSGPSWSKGRP